MLTLIDTSPTMMAEGGGRRVLRQWSPKGHFIKKRAKYSKHNIVGLGPDSGNMLSFDEDLD